MRREKKKRFLIFTASLVIALFLVVGIYFFVRGGFVSYNSQVDEGPTYSSTTISTQGPNYFFPWADVYLSIRSPYAKWIKDFSISASTDNVTWVQMPINEDNSTVQETLTFPASINPLYRKIGQVPLNGFANTIYYRTFFLPRDLEIQNQTITFVDVVKSVRCAIQFDLRHTPQTTVLFILVFIAFFSFIFQTINYFLKSDSDKKPIRKSRQYQSRKYIGQKFYRRDPKKANRNVRKMRENEKQEKKPEEDGEKR